MEIHVYLTGRLGNQLFQYAFARHLQKEYGGKIICNFYELEHRSEKAAWVPGKFNYEMSNYKLNDSILIEDIKLPWFADFSNPIIRIVKKVIPRIYFNLMASKGYLLWQKNSYINIPAIRNNEIIVNGWWQDVRFFHDVEAELSNEIVPTTKPISENEYLYNIAERENSVCVSIRGGNYLVPKVKKKLFVCDKEYFYNAIELIKSKVRNAIFIVFSDDLEWVKSYIKLEEKFPECKFYYESGKDTVEEKLRMMTKCKHFIISNSSFSWWAQYLAKNENKIVIAPDAWFTNGDKNGLYIDDWILIPTQTKDM